MNYRLNSSAFSNAIILGAIIAVSVFYFSFTSDDKVVGMLGDDAAYLIQAELYSPWVKNNSPAVEYIQKRSFYPPVYPIVLGFLGADTHNLILASVITVSILILSFITIGYFSFKVTGSKNIALLIALIVAFLPKSILFSQDLYSEFLFMCFIFSAFVLMNKDELKSEEWLLVALIITLASLTRSIGISLSCAFIIILLIKRPTHYLYYLLLCCMPFLLWMLSRYVLIGDVNYITQMMANSESIQFYDILNLLQTKIVLFIQAWSRLFLGESGNNIFITSLLVIFFTLSIIGFYLRFRKYKLDSIFLPIYLLILIIWPFNESYLIERFIYPVFPLSVIYISVAIKKLKRNYQYVPLCILLLFSLHVFMYTSADYIKRGFLDVNSELKPYTRTGHWLATKEYEKALLYASTLKIVIESLPSLSKYVPENECVYSIRTPLVLLFSHRKSLYFPDVKDSADHFYNNTDECDYFLAMPMTFNIKQPLYYPLNIVYSDERYEFIPLDDKNDSDIKLILIKRITSIKT